MIARRRAARRRRTLTLLLAHLDARRPCITAELGVLAPGEVGR